MLGYIDGKLISKNTDALQCTVVVQDLGYEVFVPLRNLEAMALNSKVALWIHTHVREDQLTLFGFTSENDKQLFRLLLTVSGLGPKTAMSLISEHGAQRLSELIVQKRTTEIAKASGVGKKIAERLGMELSSKLEKMAWFSALPQAVTVSKGTLSDPSLDLREDLTSALTNLGYHVQSIKTALDRLFLQSDIQKISFEKALKLALREISGRTSGPNLVTEDTHVGS